MNVIHRRNIIKLIVFVFGLIAIICLMVKIHKLKKSKPGLVPSISVITISTYQESLFELDKIDKNTLVLFDVDGTLITSPVLNTNYFSWWFKILFMITHPTFINTNWENAYSKMWERARFVLIEPLIVDFIKALQNKGATVLALTSMESGSYGVICSMPIWRYNMLKAMGIEFSQNYEDTVFTVFPKYRSNYPILYRGILCANQQDKGRVLGAFLDYTIIKPSKIISFDDDLNALQSIGQACKQHEIAYNLFNYTRGNSMKSEWNTAKSLKTFAYLVSEDLVNEEFKC